MIGESIFDWVIYGISILIFASALIEGKTTRYPALFFYGSLILMLIKIKKVSFRDQISYKNGFSYNSCFVG